MKLTKILMLGAALLYVSAFTSCVKDELDEPPASGTDPSLVVNKSIAGLKAMYNGNITRIDSDWVFKGVVVADDRSGNFYKSIVIQDSTGGINIQIDQSDFYTSYKVGRNVYVKCKGLFIGDYNGLIQLGGYNDNGSVGRIPQSLIGHYLIGGAWNQPVPVKVVYNINASLDYDDDQNTLVRLEGVHFATPCTTYADMVGQTSGNRDLIDAYGNTIIVRTSNFATFAASIISGDTGSVTGVFQIYNNDRQLVIRDLGDVIMDPPNCVPVVTGPVGTGGLMTIASVRALYAPPGNPFVTGTKVRGTVISDRSTNNINSQNLILQDATGGIIVRFTSTHLFNLNDSLEINIGGDSLVTFQQGVEINYVSTSSVTVLGTGSVAPNVVTASYIASHLSSLESTLIKVTGATLSGSGTYSGSVDVVDATGSVIMYTRSSATFASTAYPTGTVSVTGFISNFNGTPEIIIRNTSDVQ